MSAAPQLPVTTDVLPRKRFTRQDVERFMATGVLDGQRLELLDGDLVDKMGQNPRHAATIQRLFVALLKIFDAALIRIQLPMEAASTDRDRSVPEPDLALLAETKPDFDHRHPRGDELLLVVEVSDTTAAFDLSRKAQIYANAGVPEYWVVDLNNKRLVVHHKPDGSVYRLVQQLSETDEVSLDGHSIRIGDILPKA